MNCIAATLATYGLFANNATAIIGSMIIGMLLGPMSGLALGIIDSNVQLIGKSLLTLAGGILIVCLIAGFWSWVNFRMPITNEMLSRTTPNFIDLMIALFGGIAGAYSLMHKKLAVAVVGVAIATALVPPLCAATIFLIKGDYLLAKGAFLLTFTNIIGIQFGYSTVLWLKGVSSKIASFNKSVFFFLKSNLIGLCIIVGLGIMLTLNLSFVIRKLIFENTVRNILTEKIDALPGNLLSDVLFNREKGKIIIRAEVTGTELPNESQVATMENQIPANYLGLTNELRIRFVKTEVITKNGRIFN
jgi:uncharacterized hydrophobic protein (TIGR00271 family)